MREEKLPTLPSSPLMLFVTAGGGRHCMARDASDVPVAGLEDAPSPLFINPILDLNVSSSPLFTSNGRLTPRVRSHLPNMAEILGHNGLMEDLCNGFRLLMDPKPGVITFESLKHGAALLGLPDDELRGMLGEGHHDVDGAFNEMEFCVIMVRLSHVGMKGAWQWAEEALLQAVEGDVIWFCY